MLDFTFHLIEKTMVCIQLFDWIKNAYSHTHIHMHSTTQVTCVIDNFRLSHITTDTHTHTLHEIRLFFGFCFKISINFKVAHECVQWMENWVHSIFSRRFCVTFFFSSTVLFSNFMICKMWVSASRTEIQFYTVHLKLDCGLIENDANRITECYSSGEVALRIFIFIGVCFRYAVSK